MSGNGFQLLGVQPHLGRLLAPSDDVPGGPPEGWPVVLSHGFWNDRFAGDPRVIGTQIRLPNVILTIAGVTPPAFQGIVPGTRPKMYLPVHVAPALDGRDTLYAPEAFFGVVPIGRLKPGVDIARANAELAVYRKELFTRFIPPRLVPPAALERAGFDVSSARRGLPFLAAQYMRPLLLMQGLVAIVLLLCCAPVKSACGWRSARLAERCFA